MNTTSGETVAAVHLFREIPYASLYKNNHFLELETAEKKDGKKNHKTEEWLLNLTTQPCFKLAGNDPHKSVSVVQRRCSKWCPCLENSLWRLMLRAHRAARFGVGGGGGWGGGDTVTLPKSFFVWRVGSGAVGNMSLSKAIYWAINVPRSLLVWLSQYRYLFSRSCVTVSVTHQGAVVQQSRG